MGQLKSKNTTMQNQHNCLHTIPTPPDSYTWSESLNSPCVQVSWRWTMAASCVLAVTMMKRSWTHPSQQFSSPRCGQLSSGPQGRRCHSQHYRQWWWAAVTHTYQQWNNFCGFVPLILFYICPKYSTTHTHTHRSTNPSTDRNTNPPPQPDQL